MSCCRMDKDVKVIRLSISSSPSSATKNAEVLALDARLES
jgi:hypothetical protein